MHLLNAFSLNMIVAFPVTVVVREIPLEEAREMALTANSAVGHADTAAVFAAVLGLPVPANRVNVILQKGDNCLVGQYRGPRLPEGATALPPGATIQWLHVTVE